MPSTYGYSEELMTLKRQENKVKLFGSLATIIIALFGFGTAWILLATNPVLKYIVMAIAAIFVLRWLFK